jgi:hypothetical protein
LSRKEEAKKQRQQQSSNIHFEIMRIRQYLLPHRMQENLSWCPSGVSLYAMLHLDSIGKILNHLLYAMMAFNVALLVSVCHASWFHNDFSTATHLAGSGSVGGTSGTGVYHAILICVLLCGQNFCLWAIINNHRISCLPFLAPTDFMLGIAVGITIGAAILSFVLSGAFHRVLVDCREFRRDSERLSHQTKLTPLTAEEEIIDFVLYEAFCSSQTLFGMRLSWWLGRFVFWLNFWSCMLLTIGRHELTTKRNLYEPIGGGGGGMDDVEEDNHRQHPYQGRNVNTDTATAHHAFASRPNFVGDYTTVPNIYSDDSDEVASVSSSQSKSQAAMLTSV